MERAIRLGRRDLPLLGEVQFLLANSGKAQTLPPRSANCNRSLISRG